MEDADKKGNYTEGAENVIDNTAQEQGVEKKLVLP